MSISNRTELEDHLRTALQIELSTIPPYLYALYSLPDSRSEPALLVRSIVVEEMLHAALVANVTLAIGARPDFSGSRPVYPIEIPHHSPPLALSLEPLSLELLRESFMRLEQPETHESPTIPGVFESLGQFYHALENGLRDLSATTDLFETPQTSAQLSNPAFYRPVEFDAEDSGGLMEVRDLDTAFAAIEVIVHQGEGLGSHRWADPGHRELTHYQKLIRMERRPESLDPVIPVVKNPTTSEYPEPLQPVSHLFNLAYRHLFFVLDDLFQPQADKGAIVDRLYLLMSRGLSGLGHYLTRQPVDGGRNSGPTFESYEVEPADIGDEYRRLAAQLAPEHRELIPLAETLATLA